MKLYSLVVCVVYSCGWNQTPKPFHWTESHVPDDSLSLLKTHLDSRATSLQLLVQFCASLYSNSMFWNSTCLEFKSDVTSCTFDLSNLSCSQLITWKRLTLNNKYNLNNRVTNYQNLATLDMRLLSLSWNHKFWTCGLKHICNSNIQVIVQLFEHTSKKRTFRAHEKIQMGV